MNKNQSIRTGLKDSTDDLVEILAVRDADYNQQLFNLAETATRQYFGSHVHLRGIIEFSNVCVKHCAYCGIGAHNSSAVRYRMSDDEIMNAVRTILDYDIHTVVLQSGEDPENTPEHIEKLIRRIRKISNIAITLSLGEYGGETYQRWRNAGADRYLLKFETYNEKLYRLLHPDCDFRERQRCLADLKKAGFQVGSGFMVGLPGQNLKDIARDLIYLASMEPDMAGIGPFIPHSRTILKNAESGDPILALKTLALARLLMPKCYLPTTTALETLEHDSRIRGLSAGA